MDSEKTEITNSEIRKLNDFDVFLWANELDEVKIMCRVNYFCSIKTTHRLRFAILKN